MEEYPEWVDTMMTQLETRQRLPPPLPLAIGIPSPRLAFLSAATWNQFMGIIRPNRLIGRTNYQALVQNAQLLTWHNDQNFRPRLPSDNGNISAVWCWPSSSE